MCQSSQERLRWSNEKKAKRPTCALPTGFLDRLLFPCFSVAGTCFLNFKHLFAFRVQRSINALLTPRHVLDTKQDRARFSSLPGVWVGDWIASPIFLSTGCSGALFRRWARGMAPCPCPHWHALLALLTSRAASRISQSALPALRVVPANGVRHQYKSGSFTNVSTRSTSSPLCR